MAARTLCDKFGALAATAQILIIPWWTRILAQEARKIEQRRYCSRLAKCDQGKIFNIRAIHSCGECIAMRCDFAPAAGRPPVLLLIRPWRRRGEGSREAAPGRVPWTLHNHSGHSPVDESVAALDVKPFHGAGDLGCCNTQKTPTWSIHNDYYGYRRPYQGSC